MKGVIILTSTGLSSQKVRQSAKKFFDNLPHKSVAIVTTAAEGKENNKYSKLAESQFKELANYQKMTTKEIVKITDSQAIIITEEGRNFIE
jgi:peptidase E